MVGEDSKVKVNSDVDEIINKSNIESITRVSKANNPTKDNNSNKDNKKELTNTNTENFDTKKNNPDTSKYLAKDFFDTIGFGFSSQQFLNIFLLQSGANYFLVGIINGLKTILSVLTSLVIGPYKKSSYFCRLVSLISGLLLSITLIALGIASQLHLEVLFSILLLFSGILVAIFGDFYLKIKSQEKVENKFIKNFSKFSLLLTAICLMVAGYTLDSVIGFKLFGINWVNSTLILAISALAFLLGLLMLFLTKPSKVEDISSIENKSISMQLFSGIKKTLLSYQNFAKNKIIAIMIIASSLIVTVQVLGNSYYGIYIFNHLGNYGFGRYLNVSIVFTIAALTSLIGPVISRINAIEYGKFPMLVFGTILMALTPLTFYFNPNIVSISMGIIIGIIGAAISGVAHGLLINDLVPELQRQEYFSSLGIFSVLPLIITIPLGAYLADAAGIETLFLVLGLILLAVVGLYFSIVLMHHKKGVKV